MQSFPELDQFIVQWFDEYQISHECYWPAYQSLQPGCKYAPSQFFAASPAINQQYCQDPIAVS